MEGKYCQSLLKILSYSVRSEVSKVMLKLGISVLEIILELCYWRLDKCEMILDKCEIFNNQRKNGK